MKTFLGSLTVLLAALCLVSCTAAPPQIMDVLEDDMREIYESRDTALPAAVIYIFQGNGVHVESPLYGDDDINAVLDAIAQIIITGETDITVADSDSCYVFINADGTEAGSVSFNGKFLERGDKKYEIENMEALAAINFPAETDRDTLTQGGPDPEMYEFLERCKTEKPASVKVVRDGSEYEITESGAIREAVDALYSIGFTMYALQGAEPPSTTFTATFVMNDGWEYSLMLYDDNYYIYEYPEPLGIWSFGIDGAEYFIETLEDAK